MTALPKVYVETSVISYLAARPSRDLLVAAHQQITFDWWDRRRQHFELFVSEMVLQEIAAGDPNAAVRRKSYVEALRLLDITESVFGLASRLVEECALPQDALEDAIHIAVAAANGMDYLLTWNCRHIANATMRSRIEAVCFGAGYQAPLICTPEELLEE